MNKNPKTGVLLVNLGTPDSTKVGDVRRYLKEFLIDRRVIDIPFLSRWMLVNLIIAPFRSPKSAKVYKMLWEDRGSPLKFYGYDLKDLLQKELGDDYVVSLGMRYQNPSIEEALSELKKSNVSEVLVIPLFPQYASATTGSVIDKTMKIISEWEVIPSIKFINQFFEEPLFIKAFAEKGKKHLDKKSYDHIIFSYHGLPERQIHKANDNCQLGACCNNYTGKNKFCYRAQCFETSKLIAKELGIEQSKYDVSFQSRLGKDVWIQPYTDQLITTLVKKGKKNILIFSPSFVADCLETTVEVGIEFKEVFEDAGGKHWQLVESLNTSSLWVDCLRGMVVRESVN